MTASDGVGMAPLTEVLDLLSERIVLYRFAAQTIVYCNKAWALAIGGEPDDYDAHPLLRRLDTARRLRR